MIYQHQCVLKRSLKNNMTIVINIQMVCLCKIKWMCASIKKTQAIKCLCWISQQSAKLFFKNTTSVKTGWVFVHGMPSNPISKYRFRQI
jgi:hypothetical protein